MADDPKEHTVHSLLFTNDMNEKCHKDNTAEDPEDQTVDSLHLANDANKEQNMMIKLL